jgi:hypothetical protein
MIAALFVDPNGVYSGLDDVTCWGWGRDARFYPGPHPVIAHPPCKRWGRLAFRAGTKGEDDGCFEAALLAVQRWGGVLEHPAFSAAWLKHELPWPDRDGGWQRDIAGGWCCHVEQGHYGHFSRKPTWLYAVGCLLPELKWGYSGQRLPAYAIERYGYEKARRIGVVAAVGGKYKNEKRAATPVPFRDVLLTMARSSGGGDAGLVSTV